MSDDDEAELPLEPEVTYLAPHAPSFKVWVDNELLEAKNGVLKVRMSVSKKLDKLMRAGHHDISANLQKVDFAAAEAAAKKHMAQQMPQAAQGAMTSDHDPMHITRQLSEEAVTENITGSPNPVPKAEAPPKPAPVFHDANPAAGRPTRSLGIFGNRGGNAPKPGPDVT